RLPPDPRRHPHPQRHPGLPGAKRGRPAPHRGQLRAERTDQEDLLMGGDPVRTHPHRHRLRHELRPHARTALDPRLPVRDRPDGPRLRRPLRGLQAPRLAVTTEPVPGIATVATSVILATPATVAFVAADGRLLTAC